MAKIPMKKIATVVTGLAAGAGVYLYLAGSGTQVVVPIRYPTNIVASNYWWDLQFSTNLTSWTTIRTNVTGSNVDVMPVVSPSFYRFRGRP